ncbi:MAG: iron uptake porin, partial [Cyanobacteria bacterium J06553_1]
MSKSSAVFKTHISSALKAPAQLSTAIARLLPGFGLISGSVFLSISSGAAMASDLKKVTDFKAVNTLTIKNQAVKNQATSTPLEQANESLSTALSLAIGSPSTELSSQLKLADLQESAASNATILSEAESSSSEGRSIESTLQEPAELAQVTSVSELSDVQPGDWAFTALQRLVEEYGCLEGYPDRSFQGNRALTRYEFAAGLNACLDTVIQILPADGLFDSAYRLQEEFAAELAAVRSQVDTLELDVAELEANQFSTTTKFNAQLFGSLNFAT